MQIGIRNKQNDMANPTKRAFCCQRGYDAFERLREAGVDGRFVRMRKLLWLIGAWVLVTGCARYEYALIEPSRLARTLGDEGTRITYEPLDYDFAVRDGMLSMAIANPTLEAVRVDGAKSYVVSPDGASHPVPVSGSIAPRSFTAMVLPPEPPAYRSQPRFSIGFGVGHFSAPFHHGPFMSHGFGYHFYDSVYEGPRDYYPVNLPNYWTWKTGQVRLRVAYEQGTTNAFAHDFVIERRKVE